MKQIKVELLDTMAKAALVLDRMPDATDIYAIYIGIDYCPEPGLYAEIRINDMDGEKVRALAKELGADDVTEKRVPYSTSEFVETRFIAAPGVRVATSYPHKKEVRHK